MLMPSYSKHMRKNQNMSQDDYKFLNVPSQYIHAFVNILLSLLRDVIRCTEKETIFGIVKLVLSYKNTKNETLSLSL